MIMDHTVIVATQATNLVSNSYYPISRVCMESVSRCPWVDEIILGDGGSFDNTVAAHEDIPKVTFVPLTLWDTRNLTGLSDPLAWWKQHSELFKMVADRAESGEKIILIAPEIENFWIPEFYDELKSNIKTMIKSKQDGFSFPLAKVLTVKIAEPMGPRAESQSHFVSQLGVFRFDIEDDAIWYGWARTWPPVVDGKRKMKKFSTKFNVTALQYDNWFFTREQFHNKMRNHNEWASKGLKTIEEAFKVMIKRKMNIYKAGQVDPEIHPPQIQALIRDQLKPEHQGYDFFGMLR